MGVHLANKMFHGGGRRKEERNQRERERRGGGQKHTEREREIERERQRSERRGEIHIPPIGCIIRPASLGNFDLPLIFQDIDAALDKRKQLGHVHGRPVE